LFVFISIFGIMNMCFYLQSVSCFTHLCIFQWYIYISFGIKTYNVSFSIGINVYKIFFNWYLLVSQNILFIFNWYHILVSKMFWYVFLICKGSLTSSLYIDSCWVYLVLRSLTTFLYVIHVCRRSFTSPFIHCILCIMWLGFSHLFFI